jgi:hypothetical protein
MIDGQTQTCNRSTFCGQTHTGNGTDFCGVEKGFLSDSRPQLGEDGRSEKSPLVHITKSIHLFKDVIDYKTGEIQRFRLNENTREYYPVDFPENALFERYHLQNSARKILEKAPHPRGENRRWRMIYCLRHLRKMASHVSVMLSEEFWKAHYKNLTVCSSVWTCSLCAAKITAGRSQEIEVATDVHMGAGGVLYMITYTSSHSRQDSILELLGSSNQVFGLRGALRRLKNSKGYKKLCEAYGLIGLIRSLEVTQGFANGWHPHVHELWFCARKLTDSEFREFKRRQFDLWREACLQSGVALPNRKYGVDVVRAFSPAEYLQKFGREQNWGTGAELTRSHIKQSRDRKGRTPFDLLRIANEKQDYSGYEAKLFAEYATAFYGARQCLWSRGLKQLFGIGEMSDEEIAEREDDKSRIIANIDRETWSKVLRLPYDGRAAILRLAETGGREAVERFLKGVI